jgi:Rhs element Vgr protein
MPNERNIPSDKPKSVVTYKILSDDTEVSRKYQLLSIVVNKEVNRIPTATLVYVDGEPSRQTFELSSKAYFEPGKDIEIQVGYSNDEKTLFKGIVIKHSIKVRDKNSLLIVECKDKAVKMTVACKSKYYLDVKDSDVIEELIDAHGLDKDVAATTVTHKQIVQYNSTDWDFMLCRADVNGLLCIANDNKLSVTPPELNADAALIIQYGATVHTLDAEIDARLQYKSVKGSVWNYTDQELNTDTEAEEPLVPEAGNLSPDSLADVIGESEFRLYNSAKIEEPELQAWVNAALLKKRLAKIRGKVTTDGTADVLPGQLIQLNGVGERFEGKLFVTGIRHQVTDGLWQSTFQFGINPEWFAQTYNVQQPLSGAMLPAIQGLHIGIATQLENDPDGEDRILVKIPVINNNEDGIWCRLASLDAGDNRGFVFRPEIGDEVIVGFINNDPRHAVVLGMLHSSAKPAPVQGSDENNEKGYVSRSKMKMVFDDDKISYTLETPGGNKIVVSEDESTIYMEDQNGNKLIMNEDGIIIESIKDIKLKAAKDLNAEGVNISIKGSAQTKLEGSAGAEISSGGATNVKGSIVNIN